MIIDCKKEYNKDKIIKAAEAIKEGKLVIFPTETVYGIGANALNKEAVSNIFLAKGRKSDNPLIVHIGDKKMINDIAKNINEVEKKLIDKFFPGPLTIILEKKDIIPLNVSGGLSTIGVRMPSNIIARDLINLSGFPIAAPSANISGKPSGTNIEDIKDELEDKVEYIIDSGDTLIGVESTVVKVEKDKIIILRPGKITKSDLEKVCPNVEIDKHILNETSENDVVLSPGMKYKHYAPNAKCLLIYSEDEEKFINKVDNLSQNQKILVLCKNHLKNNFKNCLLMGENEDEISKNIFSLLRKVDKYDVDLVVIQAIKPEGLGLAIMNRLIRACDHNYIEL